MTAAAQADYSDKRVILVDDNAALRGILRAALQSFGFRRVMEADCVDSALEQLSRQRTDLVITDWKMSPRDGLDLVRALRAPATSPAPFVPVIMLTAYSDGERIKQARDAGANAFLVKPFTAATLATTIREAFEDKREFITTADFFGPDRRATPRKAEADHQPTFIAAS
ncbi:MAG: response regulator [Alphaproteobacteria bacterium]|nr:response regulator [Alphaproteobacteria bacterium]